jgi:hypothetical protein
MFYLFKGLDCIPHGQVLVKNRKESMDLLIKNDTITNHISPQSSNSLELDYVKVFYPGSSVHNNIPDFDKEIVLDFLMACCKKVQGNGLKPDEKRDGSLSANSEVRQFNVGFSRLQGLNRIGAIRTLALRVTPIFTNKKHALNT